MDSTQTEDCIHPPHSTREDCEPLEDWWADFKSQIIITETGPKQAGDCTGDDWLFAAAQLRHNAKKLNELGRSVQAHAMSDPQNAAQVRQICAALMAAEEADR